ncbi:ABC transporter permease [Rhodoplanes azumiensis]|uniref:ABC transporter permease n=1 Tax=Rhodoplanes azumiensis TaxID=1897628 RepID=A0ABW5AJE0_9BRAD
MTIQQQRRKRHLVRAVTETAAAPVLALLILAVWEIGAPLAGLSSFILPTPTQILGRIVRDHELIATHAGVTLFETVAGFAIAAVTGVGTALMIFYSRLFERAIYPLLVALQTIPKVALALLLVLYLGYGYAPKLFLSFLLAFFPVVIATVVGLNSLDKTMVSLVRSMGANEWQTFVKVRLPAALPSLFGGLKVGISLSVIGAVIGEYVAAEKGLGYLQLQASSQFDTTLSFAAMIVIAALGVVTFWSLEALEKRAVFQREAAR